MMASVRCSKGVDVLLVLLLAAKEEPTESLGCRSPGGAGAAAAEAADAAAESLSVFNSASTLNDSSLMFSC